MILFLELAWVEVSSDGIHFVRFPAYSRTVDPVGGFGHVDPTRVYGFAGKYKQGYGTPYDLTELKDAYEAALADADLFPGNYEAELIANYPHLDLNSIRYVRLTDVIGDGSETSFLRNAATDEGYPIYDPYPTSGSAGFDLDAVGVMNQQEPVGLAQSIEFDAIPNQRYATAVLTLTATASSGLPVSYEVVSGPAGVLGNQLTFSGKGTVIVEASQPGDATYAAAAPVQRNFVVADELQYLFVAPISNQVIGASAFALNVVSSSGLASSVQVRSGPEDVVVDPETHVLSIGETAGTVVLEASQVGDATYAPAEIVLVEFEIVAAGDPQAPKRFAEWQVVNGITGTASTDSDGDGLSDLREFVNGSDPMLAGGHHLELQRAEDGFFVEVYTDPTAAASFRILSKSDLLDSGSWDDFVPLETQQSSVSVNGKQLWLWRFVMAEESAGAQFWKLEYQTN